MPEIQPVTAKHPLIEVENSSEDQNTPIMMALKQPLTTVLPPTPLTMPVDLAKAHYNHLRKIYGYKREKTQSSMNKKDKSVTSWVNSLMDPFQLISEVSQMQEKLKFWIVVVGLCLTLAWNVVVLLTFIVIGVKLAWISLKVVSAALEIVLACLKLPKTCIKSFRRWIRRISRQ